MYFILSKTLDFLVSPAIWLLGLLLFALLSKNQKRKKIALRTAFILLIVLSNPFIINTLLLNWEVPPIPLNKLKTYEIGIVLTGITKSDKSPEDRVYLEYGADRIAHALLLYHKGKIKKILITGGTIDIFGNKKISEARRLAQFLKTAAVPGEDIIVEENARNTRENALFSKKIIQAKFPSKTCLLITSGFHMRRARACFRKAGLEIEPFSAGIFSADFSKMGFHSFLPSEKSIYLWHVLVHEITGFLVYKLLGYA